MRGLCGYRFAKKQRTLCSYRHCLGLSCGTAHLSSRSCRWSCMPRRRHLPYCSPTANATSMCRSILMPVWTATHFSRARRCCLDARSACVNLGWSTHSAMVSAHATIGGDGKQGRCRGLPDHACREVKRFVYRNQHIRFTRSEETRYIW